VIRELRVVHSRAHRAVGGEEFRLGRQRDRVPAAVFGPRAQVGEIHVGGEVLPAEAMIDLRALVALMVEVGP